MDDISFALNPLRFRKFRKPPIRLYQSASRVWPLAAINGREPVILDSDQRQHGIELAYPRYDATDAIVNCPAGTPNGTAQHIMPGMTQVLAIDDGEIVVAARNDKALEIVIDHGLGRASCYGNLEAVCAIRTDLHRPRPQYVRAGDVIGYVGAPEPGAFKRLYFELWQGVELWRGEQRQFVAVNPRKQLTSWELRQRTDRFTPPPPTARKEAA